VNVSELQVGQRIRIVGDRVNYADFDKEYTVKQVMPDGTLWLEGNYIQYRDGTLRGGVQLRRRAINCYVTAV